MQMNEQMQIEKEEELTPHVREAIDKTLDGLRNMQMQTKLMIILSEAFAGPLGEHMSVDKKDAEHAEFVFKTIDETLSELLKKIGQKIGH